MTDDTDLSARGIMNGLVLGLVFWGGLIGGIWLAVRLL